MAPRPRPRPSTDRPTRGGGASGSDQQTYEGAQSVYGNTRGDSVGYNPRNPKAYWATQAVKAYRGIKDD